MEKKYFYVDNLHEYGKRLYYKKRSKDWSFVQLTKRAFCLYNERTGRIVMSRKHSEDKPDIYIAFAICYHKYMGWAEPKERVHVIEKQAAQLKIGDKFYIAVGLPKQELRCCGYLENGVVLYEFTDNLKFTNVCRLNPDISVFIKKEN